MPRKKPSDDPSATVAVLLIFAAILLVVGIVIWRNANSPHEAPASPRPPATRAPGTPSGGAPPDVAPANDIASPHLFLGNPSDATSDARGNRDNLLLLKPICAISYNDAKGTPNWVSWRLRASDTGNAPRKPTFDPELALPDDFYRVTQRDYTGSGFDRGHMCPHSDRDANQVTSDATFVMSNIIPQAPAVNEKAWATLERYTRNLVTGRPMTAFVISGPWGQGGVGSKGPATSVGHGRVAVPAECWKVIVVLPTAESEDPRAVRPEDARVIAVRMPNDNDAVGMEWTPFRTTPASIEAETGYRFFTTLRPDVAQTLRTRQDAEEIPPATPPEARKPAKRQRAPAPAR